MRAYKAQTDLGAESERGLNGLLLFLLLFDVVPVVVVAAVVVCFSLITKPTRILVRGLLTEFAIEFVIFCQHEWLVVKNTSRSVTRT